jgi:four helix bundle protein
MKTHKDLDIWKRGLELVTEVYKRTKNFPKEETYGLRAQMRRAAVSYPCNIALGSLSELEIQVIERGNE